MKNNNIGNISMQSSKRPSQRFNLSGDCSTTFGFGEVQPTICRFLIPGSKMVVNQENLTRLAPMVLPTFGRLKLKSFSQFVPCVDIFEPFNEFFTEKRFSYGANTYVPGRVPWITLGLLSSMVLIGARFSIYKWQSRGADTDSYLCPVASNPSVITTDFDAEFGSSYWYGSTTFSNQFAQGLQSSYLSLGAIISDQMYQQVNSSDRLNMRVPMGFDVGVSDDYLSDSSGNVAVSLEGADYVLSKTMNNNKYMIAFKLSGFGQRIRKMLIGSGYQVNFDSLTEVSLLPLMATYKAYFDLFNLPQWTNYEDTNQKKLHNAILTNNVYQIAPSYPTWDLFTRWIYDCGCCWYTSAQDYVSAHQANVHNNNSAPQIYTFVDIDRSVNPTLGYVGNAVHSGAGLSENSFMQNADARITDPFHGQLDSELLKAIYRVMNRDSVLGQRVEQALRARGFNAFVDNCKSYYIGKIEVPLKISDVVAQSDTYNSNSREGTLLGEYGGRGLGYGQSEDPEADGYIGKPLSYSASEFGFWVTLSVIVPDAGYAQAIDPNILSTRPIEFYNPDFDGMGMEISRKLNVVAAQEVSTFHSDYQNSGSLDESFGFVPRYSSLKIGHSILNGDFNLRSRRTDYSPYTLDKLIYVSEIPEKAPKAVNSSGLVEYISIPQVTPSDIPHAGNSWRFPTRYGFLAHFHRIFANKGQFDEIPLSWISTLFNEISVPYVDNFMTHFVYNIQLYAPMLAIEDSYETKKEGNDGVTDMTVAKA